MLTTSSQMPKDTNGPGHWDQVATVTRKDNQKGIVKVYQVAYVIVKAANSPRPGAWILERSIDGENYGPWQYFATSDKDCLDRYGIPARKGKPHYFTDSEVICTSFYSKLMPMENGEIHTFLIHGRPGANETSPELLEFTKARYVRFRFQGLRGSVDPLPAWLSQDHAKDKRLFYSIRDISIGGQCMCNGHAASCRHNVASGHPECECSHHTCGPNCDRCCPLFNQIPWGPGTSREARVCQSCNCHGHAKSCHYDEDVNRAALSLDIDGNYRGGGVCDNCIKHTAGINCERCAPGYYRPAGTKPEAEHPCIKCDCDETGSSGKCGYDGAFLKCDCKLGFVGLRCGECADGFRGYPNCEPCLCDSSGSMVDECESECVCKVNVDGKFCDHCKPGYFSLQEYNPEGCSACYCSGATTLCEAAHLLPRAYQTGNGWLITDISVTEVEEPTLDERNMLSVGNFEISGIEAYYWLAPSIYLGNKLETYGSDFVFKVHWVVIRGDTSGKPTKGPNIIIAGHNGMRIASGDDLYAGTNMTFRIKLAEYNRSWYHIPYDIKDIVTRLRRTEYKGEFVTRSQFLNVLSNIKYILLRAKFHTDQIEGSLEEAIMYSGNFEGQNTYSAVEECSCPSGYAGLSCESCQYGYVQIASNASNHQQVHFCAKCDCNGHSATCNVDTGECFCEHNTIGETCERCAPGFYGNPLAGNPTDCKKCACPLEEEENNFSPSCQLDSSSLSNDDDEPGYVCTQCPKGYTGDHCEICDDGYYGVPSKIGGKCEPCNCGGGSCDRITGQCLGCRGNTEGWRCDRCKPSYFGDPAIGCEACLCDLQGSTNPVCNNITGECECKDHFIGRTCNKCEIGFGNVTAQCMACTCDPIGSKSNVCDQHSGLCDCQLGVEGFRCDACQHLHYGFSETGCQSCKCNIMGSLFHTCDIITGQCRCKSHYTGRMCDNCELTYWHSKQGCDKCDCDPIGSDSQHCNQSTGQCPCKPGIEGRRCDTCRGGYYGFSSSGCKLCDECKKVDHICDSLTGKCVCPPNTFGEKCHKCIPDTWDLQPRIGCKACNCSIKGSAKSQCNLNTGICSCRQGYKGSKCDMCDHGYYGYPKCKRCNCNEAGTDKDLGKCDPAGVCQCGPKGFCPCKNNAVGKQCSHCKDGYFNLHVDNSHGCTKCFCFGRSTLCQEAQYTWDNIRAQNRSLSINSTTAKKTKKLLKSVGQFSFIELTHSGDLMEEYDYFEHPLYWKLPKLFNGDNILSYGGYLRFHAATRAERIENKNRRFRNYPLVIIEGNVIIHHNNPNHHSLHGRGPFEIKIHESLWEFNTDNDFNNKMSRDLLMLTLQEVKAIYIKATDYDSFEKISLGSISLDNAIHVPGNPPPLALGVEICQCPKEFNGTSCQNPNKGYYRQRLEYSPINTANITQDIIDAVIGKSVLCKCNNRSSLCNIETGECENCSENTSGTSCEHCAVGYFGNPMIPNDKCKACSCPSPTQNFAWSCTPIGNTNEFNCFCKEGYTGTKCNICTSGFYGEPNLPNGSCKPCNCNEGGRINKECDQITGYCSCKSGIIGDKCARCEKPGHVLENGICTPCDKCTQILLNDFENLKNLLNTTHHLQSGILQPPWETLNEYEHKYGKLQNVLDVYLDKKDDVKFNEDDLVLFKKDLKVLDKLMAFENDSLNDVISNSNDNLEKSIRIKKDARSVKNQIKFLTRSLNEFGKAHISTEDALRRGTVLLADIKQLDQIDTFSSAWDTVDKCQTIYDTLEYLTKNDLYNPKQIRDNLTVLRRQVDGIENILSVVDTNLQQAHTKHTNNTIAYNNLTSAIDKLRNKIKLIKEQFDVVEITALNESLNEDYQDILDARQEVANLMKNVSEKQTEMASTINMLQNVKDKITTHTSTLERNITQYKQTFNVTPDEWNLLSKDYYKGIVSGVNDSNKTIQAINSDLDIFLSTTIKPHLTDSILSNSSIALADSERLISRVNNLKNDMIELSKKHNKIESNIDMFKGNNWQNGLANNNFLEAINSIKADLKDEDVLYNKIRNWIKAMSALSNDMRRIYNDAATINLTAQYGLLKDYRKILNLTSPESIAVYNSNINVVKEQLQAMKHSQTKINVDVIKNVNQAFEEFQSKKNKLQLNIDNLKNEIKRTVQTASVIKIPVDGETCSRSYKLDFLEPSIFTTIYIKFHYLHDNKQLMKISNNDQFIQIEIKDGKLKMSYKIVEEGEIIGSSIVTGNEVEMNMTRIGSYLSFSVNNGDTIKRDVSNFPWNFQPIHFLHLGGFAGSTKGLPGCIKDIVFNDNQRVGLWQFIETIGGCSGCNREKTIEDNSRLDFNGDGYIKFGSSREFKPNEFNVQFKMRTFDENSLLFLSIYNGTYMFVALEGGHIRCELQYKDNIETLSVITRSTYNNGSTVAVTCTKIFINSKDQLTLAVNNERLNREHAVSASSILKIRKADIYYGGLPPNVKIPDFIKANFLGKLSEVYLYTKPVSLQNTDYYGVNTYSEDSIQYKSILFKQSGFVTLSNITKSIKELIFIVSLHSSDGLLILIDEKKIVISVKDGKILVSINGSIILESSKEINDETLHSIKLTLGKNAILYVDEVEQRSVKLPIKMKRQEIKTMNIGGTASENNKFRGIIKDILITDDEDRQTVVYVDENTYVKAKGAMIGRQNDVQRQSTYVSTKKTEVPILIHENDSMKDMQDDGCEKITYVFEPNAIKFGDKPDSYVLHHLKEHFWKMDYSIEFEFRTLHNNGILYISFGPKEHYTLFEIKDGRVHAHIKGKKNKKFSIEGRIDDGNWHHIVVSRIAKQKRKLIITLDGVSKKVTVPPNKITGKFYFGNFNTTDVNVPRNEVLDNRLFRGCMRSFKINGDQRILNSKNTILHSVGQCFPNVENGSYFRGDSYAVYSSLYHLTSVLELSFHFRTTEQNGIFMSISNLENSPALSIELQNGAIVLSVDLGNSMITNVTNNLPRYTICNNKWHTVKAIFSSELTIIVDGVTKSWVLPDTEGLLEAIEAPLYIGGIPDSAPGGTLKIRENFKGCLRNLKLGNKNLEWVQMEELNNIALNSCPIIV